MCDCPRTPTTGADPDPGTAARAERDAATSTDAGPGGPRPDGSASAPSRTRLTRRLAFGAVGGGALAGVLAACGGGEDPDSAPGGEQSGTPGPTPGATEELASTEEIPVGEGKVLTEEGLVLTQPEEGTFHAFSSTCTHEGCPLDAVVDGRIQCPCHGSRFSIEDGSPLEGPATRALEEFEISVENGVIRRV
ncbi:Rieske (2Fe-2S) protein [Nocardiopsis sp. CT-R113]|uniref:Cytochrome bc1 complex Rieske iron-sulfur subunit n=1 Tax=Nocardiopsis codii TaxID=3065942 RepID=A0ABU7K6B9_9ACTN|nr:Rieske (2Fe-2S) protein [Nocardiopsis sp. CT-R113]MEE2037796.1 Rieske (2Fe-2S) protein [Nocardiopsis sp. CT-R113]